MWAGKMSVRVGTPSACAYALKKTKTIRTVPASLKWVCLKNKIERPASLLPLTVIEIRPRVCC